MGLKQDLLSKRDLKRQTVRVEAWETDVTVQEMSARQRILINTWADGGEDFAITLTGEKLATVAAWCVIDPETGSRVFDDDDVSALADKSLGALQELFTAIMGLSATPEDAEGN
jgi:hypothetical protein